MDQDEALSSSDELSDTEQSHFEEDIRREAPASTEFYRGYVGTTRQYWCFNVHKHLNTTNVSRDYARPLTRFKLNLDNRAETDGVRTDLRIILNTLAKQEVIKSPTDIYTDYLSHLLRHTKNQLQGELREDVIIPFVLCVPAKLQMNACRIMQSALEQAVKAAKLTEGADGSVRDLFMISEPEAAAECVLAEANDNLLVRLPLIFGEDIQIN